MKTEAKGLKRSSQSRVRAASAPSAELRVDGRPTANTKIKNGSAKSAGVTVKVKFGSVTVKVTAPSAAVVKRNVIAGQMALARAKARILKPGVRIASKRGVPLFHADPDQPGRLIRELDGEVQSGHFVDGTFKTA